MEQAMFTGAGAILYRLQIMLPAFGQWCIRKV